jgi:uncharacterized protein YkwD
MWKWARGLFGALLVVYAIYGIRAVVVPVLCPPPKVIVAPKPVPIGNEFERAVIQLTNQERTKRGLRPLKINTQMMSFARSWSATQSRTRMHHSRGPYGENVAYGQSTPQAVMNAWMTSPGHRRNILNSRYTEIGVGYVYNGRPYHTQVFR